MAVRFRHGAYPDKKIMKGMDQIIMELKKLTEQTLEMFDAKDTKELIKKISENYNNHESMERFCELINNDLNVDWLQKIYQYYEADRKNKGQDYTPQSLASLMASLTLLNGDNKVVDMCAGSGALTIATWRINKNIQPTCIEFDENVIPILVFNLALRNIQAVVKHEDVLSREVFETYEITKGEKFGEVVRHDSID